MVFGICNPLNFLVPKLLDMIIHMSCDEYIINAGCYIGYVYYLKKLFNEITEKFQINNYKCDQKLLNNY